ncbi:MAG TPA: hypothetical protein DEP91_11885 [Sphingomonas bacterium]|uniref:Sulfurtransferase FdhD n=1 Tax=Sphingomonas bacterium TaxID=1895847 RepID=A0A3D0WDP2_9SPHN|nr:hypothetical protein [Sphingomonas bacterium]
MIPTRPLSFIRITADGTRAAIVRPVAAEMPIAVEFNGIGYAVLMATPADLNDLVTGFALAERLVERADELPEIDVHRTKRGMIVRATLVPKRAARVADRVRHRVSESSCGLCGIENLEQALRPLPRVTAISDADDAAIFAALAALRDHQPLNRETGGVHGAALVARDGTIRLAREDVGRHNAFDKLIGAMAYPAIVSLIAVLIVIFLVTYVVPQIATVFVNSKRALPLLTVTMLAISAFVRQWGWLMLLGLVWTLQGANILGGSVMSGQSQWLYIGIVVLLAGAALLFWLRRSRP